jgi:hypothetical protein
VTPDALFLATIDELDEFIARPGSEYDVLRIAAPLRQLFLDGSRSLVAQVNDEPPDDVELVFAVRDDLPDANVAGWYPIQPTGDGRPVADVDLDGFLGLTIIRHWPDNDQTKSRELTVRELILHLANVEGGVHRGEPDKAWQKALAEYGETVTYQTQTGQYTGPAFSIIGVVAVARKGLEPLREKVSERTSPVERATGRARQRPPKPEPTTPAP